MSKASAPQPSYLFLTWHLSHQMWGEASSSCLLVHSPTLCNQPVGLHLLMLRTESWLYGQEITPGGPLETIWAAGIELRSWAFKASPLPTVLSLALPSRKTRSP